MWKRQALEAGKMMAAMRCELEDLREIMDVEPPAADSSDDGKYDNWTEEDC